MNESQGLVSITEASKRLGINRSTLSRFVDEAKLKKLKNGRVALIEYQSAQELVQLMAAKGKVRVPKTTVPTKSREDKSYDQLQELFREIKQERDQLKEKCHALESENLALQGEFKLLKAAHKEAEKAESNPVKGLSWLERGKVIAKIFST